METKDLRLAVLIDADNVPYSGLVEMFEEIAKYGTPTFKRIYADWTRPNASGWKKVLLEHAITPVQQYSYTTGKNSSDSALIIDAMDILYTGKVDGFCIVSSDSDFTRLATRLREAGMMVIGIGEKKAPAAFISACEKFIYLEILQKPGASSGEKQKARKTKDEKGSPLSKVEPALIKLFRDSITALADENGWAFLGDIGNLMLKKKPDFDSRNYGFPKLLPLLKSMKKFEIHERETGKANIKHIYVRNL
ncbi:MAG TPA: NYN domain-containing protein [Ferruginibacter sp.]|nr:NYN domain-containing protein [Ferruginibacter sp.]HRN79510.1 NYN domain-containing protein [Ferruginibacter sp.]HRO17317.1 NYN domain-containing protein [Ferruginibacter sp.]HRQ20715.1 NYN domain-containing protein [Ferruginibacter sp.]